MTRGRFLYLTQTVGFTLICHPSSFVQGIKYVMMPEGLKDFYWLHGLLKGGRVSAGDYYNEQ